MKLREYWEDCPEINRIRNHQKLEQFLRQVDDPGSDRWRPFRDLLLDEDELNDLQCKYPRRLRRQIEQRWSFNELGKLIELPEIPNLSFTALSFNYGLSSHLIHQDADAVGLVWDRLERDTRRREALEIAHAAREISDVITTAAMRALLLYRLDCGSARQVVDLYNSQEHILSELKHAQQDWHDIEYKSTNSKE